MSKIGRHIRDERGVAMATVLLVAAALTALASVAAFTMIAESRASTEDRKAAQSLASAEGGIDRLTQYIRSGQLTWNELRKAGCPTPISIPTGAVIDADGIGGQAATSTFSASLVLYDPATRVLAPAAAACATGTDANPRVPRYFALVSTGTDEPGSARREVREIVKIDVNLDQNEVPTACSPDACGFRSTIGVYADRIETFGQPRFNGISAISPGDVLHRQLMRFSGTDPFYTLADFWPSMCASPCTTYTPTAMHTLGAIFYRDMSNRLTVEHPEPDATPNINCNGNRFASSPSGAGQSQWDQSGLGGTIAPPKCTNWVLSPAGPPPTSKFSQADMDRILPKPVLPDQDYLAMKSSAQEAGLYCFVPTSGSASCSKMGAAPYTPAAGPALGASDVSGLPNDFVAYIEYENPALALTTNKVTWTANVWNCDTDPALNRSAVVVVRNGSFTITGVTTLNGAVMVPEGIVSDDATTTNSGPTVRGAIFAEKVVSMGDIRYELNSCWIANMPGVFLDVTHQSWVDVDR